jgi:hypothetical protein
LSRAQARKGFAKGKTGQWFTPLPAVVTYKNNPEKYKDHGSKKSVEYDSSVVHEPMFLI